MKKLFTFLLFFGLSLTGISQSLVIHKDGVAISGSVLTIDSAATADHTYGYYYIVNTTGSAINCSWNRRREADMDAYTDQICDDVLCFDADDADYYARPLTFSIPAGDSSVFQPKVFPHGVAGCAIYTYKVYQNFGSFQDSIQVKYRFGGVDCFLGVAETPVTYSVYPNPVSNLLNINITTNGHVVQMNIYNIMGEIVLKETLTDGMNQVAVNGLTNGVYFYSVLKDGALIETKKLIVRH